MSTRKRSPLAAAVIALILTAALGAADDDPIVWREAVGANVEDVDGNRYVDCDDYGCSRNPFVTVCVAESTDALCGNGIDDDANGYRDCDDHACRDTVECQ